MIQQKEHSKVNRLYCFATKNKIVVAIAIKKNNLTRLGTPSSLDAALWSRDLVFLFVFQSSR